ncbi:probable transcriptional regulator SLK2 isoform X1 [Tanacetum coccineum]
MVLTTGSTRSPPPLAATRLTSITTTPSSPTAAIIMPRTTSPTPSPPPLHHHHRCNNDPQGCVGLAAAPQKCQEPSQPPIGPSRAVGGMLLHSNSSSGVFFQGDMQSQGVGNVQLGSLGNNVMNNVATSEPSIGASSMVTEANSGLAGGGPHIQRSTTTEIKTTTATTAVVTVSATDATSTLASAAATTASDNSIAYWRKFVAEYYSPRAKKRWCLSQYDNVGHHSLGVFPQAAVVSQLVQVAQKCQSTIAEGGSEGVPQQDLQTNSSMVVTAWRQLARSLELQSLNDLGFSKRYVRQKIHDLKLPTKSPPVSNSNQNGSVQGWALQNNRMIQQQQQPPSSQGGGQVAQQHMIQQIIQDMNNNNNSVGGGEGPKPSVSGQSNGSMRYGSMTPAAGASPRPHTNGPAPAVPARNTPHRFYTQTFELTGLGDVTSGYQGFVYGDQIHNKDGCFKDRLPIEDVEGE